MKYFFQSVKKKKNLSFIDFDFVSPTGEKPTIRRRQQSHERENASTVQ